MQARAESQPLEWTLAREALANDAQHRHLAGRPVDEALPVAGESSDRRHRTPRPSARWSLDSSICRSCATAPCTGARRARPIPRVRSTRSRNAKPTISPPRRSTSAAAAPRGAAGREQVVDDQHALTRRDRVGVHLDDRLAVLERVRLRDPRRRAAVPPCGSGANPAPRRSATAPPRMNPRDSMPATDVDARVAIRRRKRRDRCAERRPVAEQQRDVLEDDAGTREIRHIADQRAQPFRHVLLLNRHRSQSIRQTLWPCPPQRALRDEGAHRRPAAAGSIVRARNRQLCAGPARGVRRARGAARGEPAALRAPRPAGRGERLASVPAARRIPVVHPTLQPVADTLFVARALRDARADLYHAIEFGQPLRTRLPVVVTVHDLIPFVMPRDYPWVRRARVLGLRLLRRADAVIAVSEATRRDVLRLTTTDPARITVIPEGIAPVFRPATAEAVATPSSAARPRPPIPARGRHLRSRASASRCSPMSCAVFATTTTSRS